MNQQHIGTTLLRLPTEVEALCYLYTVRDGLTQAVIAQRLGVDQRTVGRSIQRTRDLLEAIRASGRFDPEELDLVLERLTGRSAHGRRVR